MTPNSPDEPFNDDPDMELEPLDELESVDSAREWTPPPEKVGEVAKRVVSDAEAGWRLDLFLAAKFPQYSRVLIRKAIQAEEGVDVSGRHGKPSFRLRPGDVVSFRLVEPPRESPIPEDVPLDVLYEDDDLAVVNKPADMVVHPARGHWSGTLVGALAHRFAGQLSQNRGPARPGIVHRLDRDTSGAIIVAKNDQAHAYLAAQFEQKRITKEYFAITLGGIRSDREVVDLPIGHHPKYRVKMAIAPDDPDAKPAITYFEVLERFRGFSAVRCLPKTGRTHQIRLHLQSLGCPILCDKLYGGRSTLSHEEIAGIVDRSPRGKREEAPEPTIVLARQALHARRITFELPSTHEKIEIEAPLPEDMARTLDELREYRSLE